MEIPDDRDGKALKELIAEGFDLTEPLDIEFVVAVPSEQAAFLAASVVSQSGYGYKIVQDETYQEWLCYCSRCMLPEHDSIVRCQSELDLLCKPFGGYADGWTLAEDLLDL